MKAHRISGAGEHHSHQQRGIPQKGRLVAAVMLAATASLASGDSTGPLGALSVIDHVDDAYHRGTVISESELAQLRGGFNIAGMQLSFGAELSTLIDNQIQLVSVLNVSRSGVDLVSQSFSDPSGMATRVGPEAGVRVVDMTPAGVNLAGLADFSGVTLQDTQGFTAALHQVTQNAILSGVVSNASGRDIQQRIDINVHVGNVGALRAAKQRAAVTDSFSGILR